MSYDRTAKHTNRDSYSIFLFICNSIQTGSRVNLSGPSLYCIQLYRQDQPVRQTLCSIQVEFSFTTGADLRDRVHACTIIMFYFNRRKGRVQNADGQFVQSPKFKRVLLNETLEFPFWGLNICVDFDLRGSKNWKI